MDPRSVLGSGDVKYHVGATGEYRTRDGRKLSVHLASNPSHLEAVDPVAIGRARAKQARIGDGSRAKVLPIVLHGDAAFAGQGVWAETLNFAEIGAYSVGGTIHVIVNNLLGFTTDAGATAFLALCLFAGQAAGDSHFPRERRRSGRRRARRANGARLSPHVRQRRGG